jgi:arginyl-tRNA synthetase
MIARVRHAILEVLEDLGMYEEDVHLELDRPKDSSHGDLTTNVALILAKKMKRKPRELAGEIAAALDLPKDFVESVEIAGPGFINLRFAQAEWGRRLVDILEQGDEFGSGESGEGRKINVEFVSANPTGPFNIVSARAAAVGSALVRTLRMAGYKAHAEFYCNDAGRQVRLLGESLRARYAQEKGQKVEVHEDGYQGEYVVEMATHLATVGNELDDELRGEAVGRVQGKLPSLKGTPDDWLALEDVESAEAFGGYALRSLIAQQRETCRRFGLHFDTWFLESDLHANDRLNATLTKLEESGTVFEKDGAKWFRSTDYGDDQDRVVVRSDGQPTYFLADVAYHESKHSRGFERAINFLGPDHHGYIARLAAGTIAFGAKEDWLEIILLQQVNLLKDGKPVEMSKRAGRLVTMDELIEEAGVDAAKFFFLMRKNNSHLDFDLELAKKQSNDNPVYYVKYAHARICSVLRNAVEQGIDPESIDDSDLDELDSVPELELLRILSDFPDCVVRTARSRELARMTGFATEVATAFHQFYHQCKVLGDVETKTRARLALCRATRIVLANSLRLLGVSAPERM